MQSIDISGFKSGVHNNKKPFLIPEDAFINLENIYVWRDELKKREGIQLLGRFRRFFDVGSIGNSGASPWTINTIYSTYVTPITPESTAEIEPESVIITFGGITFTDQGNGILTSPTPGNIGYINYLTGVIVLTHTAGAGVPATASFAYYPGLPAMGIIVQEIAGINDERTLWFDTKYCYFNSNGDFFEYLPASAATWDGTNSDFFWGTNYRGSDSFQRLFFVTNFVNSVGSPMRYTDSITWTPFAPYVSRADPVDPAVDIKLYTARVLIPYYGRLLALNTWEGTETGGPGAAKNYFNRCRFSQIGSPIQVDAWRSDQFGKGGFIDAPINEDIISATFYKNTLIVFFERSTWRLQYIGEYGLPFIWERISSDFGSESTFSTVLFDAGVLAVGDKAIVGSSAGDVQRIDLDIPDTVYAFQNDEDGPKRVHGVRDFQKELVYWCYPDYNFFQLSTQIYPNKSLVYNYRNNTWAFFRNNVTCFGTFQYTAGITWDRLDVFWDAMDVFWNTLEQPQFPSIVSGNQQGFVHFFGYPNVEVAVDSSIDAMDQESLSVTGVTVTTIVTLQVRDHNLVNDEIIYLTGLNFVDTVTPAAGSTTLNDQIYIISVIDKDNIKLYLWDEDSQLSYDDFVVTNVGDYMGGGVIALFPRLYAETKDFNPFKQAGQNIKTSYIDFLFDVSSPSPISVRMQMNTTPNSTGNNTEGNLLIGNTQVETYNAKTGYITDVQLSDPMDITAPWIITSKNHALLTGDEISPQGILGTTELNGNNYTITFLTTDTFSVDAASATFTTYISGGFWEQTLQQYYTLSSQYAWHRFFATCFGQFLRIVLTYNNDQMFQISTHRQNFVLNAIKLWFRPGGKNIFGK